MNIDTIFVGDVADDMPDGESLNLMFGNQMVTITVKSEFFEIQKNRFGLDFMVNGDWVLRIHSPQIGDDDDTEKVETVTDDTEPHIAKWQQWELDNPDDEDGDEYELHPSECDECPSCGGDLVSSVTSHNGNAIYTDVCAICGYTNNDIEWREYPYEMVSDDVILVMQSKFTGNAYHHAKKYGGLYIAIRDFGDVKRGMVGKYYWSKSAPNSSDGMWFTLPDGSECWHRWIWDDVVPYEPELVAENNKPA